jgi:diguanylate cyclase (GGDEF)-like protein
MIALRPETCGSDIGGIVRIARALLEELGGDCVRARALDELLEAYSGTSWALLERVDCTRYDMHVRGYVSEDDARELARFVCDADVQLTIEGASRDALRYHETPRVCTWPSASGQPLVALGLWTDPGAAGPTDAELVLATHLVASVVLSAQTLASVRRRVSVDEQTGVLTRAAILEALERERARARRYGRRLSVLYVDLDGLKRVNDAHGHRIGDHLILALARTLLGSVRSSDSVGRLGGDEFLVLLPETDGEGALACAERLRQALVCVRVPAPGEMLSLSASIGSATLDEIPATDLVDLADKRMLLQKRGRRARNRRALSALRPVLASAAERDMEAATLPQLAHG